MMMKKTLLAGLMLGAFVGAASAQSIEFRGALCLTAVASACTTLSSPWNIGDCATMRYSPPNIGTNGAATNLNLIGGGFANSYYLASGSLVGTTFKTVAGTKITRTLSTWAPTMRITSQTPTPSATNLSEVLAGDITTFDNNAGCNVTFRAAATKKP
jgi:hypothetical protein